MQYYLTVESKRLFIAIPISNTPVLSVNYQLLRRRFKPLSIRWMAPEDWHLTLYFLGNTPIEIIPSIANELHQIASHNQCFSLEIGRLGTFAPKNNTQVLWYGVSNSNSLFMLQGFVNDVVMKCGFAATTTFRPHITLARFPKNILSSVEGYLNSSVFDNEYQEVKQFSLYESLLSPQGSVYRILENFRLSHRRSDAC